MLQKHLFSSLFLFNTITAVCQTDLSYPAEKKVDYLEKIYFSGSNKEGLTDSIEVYVSRMSKRFDSTLIPSPEYLKQFVFLQKIQPQLPNTKDACDILDLLAVGIRNIDIEEAMAQKIKKPSEDAVNNSADALEGIGKVNNAVSSTSGALNSLAWANYYRSGKTVGFGATRSIAGAADMLETGVELAKQGKDIANALGMFGGKNKSCKEVDKKNIALGEHKFTPISKQSLASTAQTETTEKTVTTVASVTATTVTINNISFKQLSTLRDLLEKMKGVHDVVTDNFNNNVAVLKVSHELKLDDLLVNITQLTSSVKLEVSASDSKTNSGILKCAM